MNKNNSTVTLLPLVKIRAEALSLKTIETLKNYLNISLSIYTKRPTEENKKFVIFYSEEIQKQHFSKELLQATFDVADKYKLDRFNLYQKVKYKFLA